MTSCSSICRATPSATIGLIFAKALNKFQDPAKLRRLVVDLIDCENWSATCSSFLGHRRSGSQHDLPSRLPHFVTRTRGCLGDVQRVARDHTLLGTTHAARLTQPPVTQNPGHPRRQRSWRRRAARDGWRTHRLSPVTVRYRCCLLLFAHFFSGNELAGPVAQPVDHGLCLLWPAKFQR